eukprot:766153-Hanusia_phi.AAC.1
MAGAMHLTRLAPTIVPGVSLPSKLQIHDVYDSSSFAWPMAWCERHPALQLSVGDAVPMVQKAVGAVVLAVVCDLDSNVASLLQVDCAKECGRR